MHAWNSHNLQIRGERTRSPRDIYIFSFLQDGPRGVQQRREPVHENVENPEGYGIDWDVVQDQHLMAHHLQHNPQEWADQNPFQTPSQLSDVPCLPPHCPLTVEQVEYFERQLTLQLPNSSRSMDERRLRWITALQICTTIM